MKTRIGFVSNSSSTSFVVTNKTSHTVDLVTFVKENPGLVNDYNKKFDHDFTNDQLIDIATKKNITFVPFESKICTFGDHDGVYGDTVLGEVYDFILRHGGESKSFKWIFLQYNR